MNINQKMKKAKELRKKGLYKPEYNQKTNLSSNSVISKQYPLKSIVLKGVKIDQDVLLFLLNNEETYNSFGSLIDFIDKIKPIPNSEIKVTFDEDFYSLRYYIKVSDEMTFEEDMTISNKFFYYIWDNFSKEIQHKNSLHLINSRNFDKL